jgi:hypothetical protein
MVIAEKEIRIRFKLQGQSQADIDEVEAIIRKRMRGAIRGQKFFMLPGRRVRLMQLYE